MRRSRLEIIRGILDVARRGATKTQVVYRSNLNFKLADACLARLLKGGYLKTVRGPEGRAQFWTTDKGIGLLTELTRLHKTIDEIMNGPKASNQPASAIPQLVRSD